MCAAIYKDMLSEDGMVLMCINASHWLCYMAISYGYLAVLLYLTIILYMILLHSFK